MTTMNEYTTETTAPPVAGAGTVRVGALGVLLGRMENDRTVASQHFENAVAEGRSTMARDKRAKAAKFHTDILATRDAGLLARWEALLLMSIAESGQDGPAWTAFEETNELRAELEVDAADLEDPSQ